ncbi:MAG: CPBP family intramembrane metalloprotease [Anaerolineales bacterium]|nr:CPBP family intramembrane metalloprotease [Anaerolineales bacterium]
MTVPWLYFGLAFGWSWLFWIPAALSGQNVMNFPVVLLLVLGGLGPPLAAILLTHLAHDSEEWRDYWRRVFDFRRISAGWCAVILLFCPLRSLLAILSGVLLGQGLPSFDTALDFLSQPLALLSFAFATLLYGPFPEELGWRGYALDRLQSSRSALASSIILGILWGLWHLPMFFMQGTYQRNELSIGSMRFWLNFCASIVALTILMTWIYNNTGRSTLAAILFHFMMNFTGEVLNLPDQLEYYNAIWTVVAAVAVVAIWGPNRLSRRWNRGET